MTLDEAQIQYHRVLYKLILAQMTHEEQVEFWYQHLVAFQLLCERLVNGGIDELLAWGNNNDS